jgi:excisionase family DNA binding protein
MNFSTGLDDHYPFDRYLTFTEASEILGSGNHTRIRNLVLTGKLPSYRIPEAKKLRIKKSELLQLLNETTQVEKLPKSA